jgi:hypothetical protein
MIIDNKKIETNFIVNDNNASPYGLEDRKIENKCKKLVNKLKKDKDVQDAFVKYTPVAQMEE